MMSSHCLEHILEADKEQQLIKQCSFLYSHDEQCRMPVFDVMSTFAVCSQHQNAVSVVVLLDVHTMQNAYLAHAMFSHSLPINLSTRRSQRKQRLLHEIVSSARTRVIQ